MRNEGQPHGVAVPLLPSLQGPSPLPPSGQTDLSHLGLAGAEVSESLSHRGQKTHQEPQRGEKHFSRAAGVPPHGQGLTHLVLAAHRSSRTPSFIPRTPFAHE